MRRITFGVRNLAIQEGFTKYLESGHIEVETVSRRLPVVGPVNYLKNKRIAKALDNIIVENFGEDLLICDDDVYIGRRDFPFETLKFLTYIAIPHGASSGKEAVEGEHELNIIPSPTCFFLPKYELYQTTMLRVLRMFNDPDLGANIDVFVDSRWPSSMPKQLLFLDGTKHIFNDYQVLELNVNKSDGAFLASDNRQTNLAQLRDDGWWDITLYNAIKAIDPVTPPVVVENGK